jgi:hypothetical protein
VAFIKMLALAVAREAGSDGRILDRAHRLGASRSALCADAANAVNRSGREIGTVLASENTPGPRPVRPARGSVAFGAEGAVCTSSIPAEHARLDSLTDESLEVELSVLRAAFWRRTGQACPRSDPALAGRNQLPEATPDPLRSVVRIDRIVEDCRR